MTDDTLTWHNDPAVKAFYVERMRRHQEQDDLIQGTFGEQLPGGWKGCAVGCVIDFNTEKHPFQTTTPHRAMFKRTGIPLWLCRAVDDLFESCDFAYARQFPLRLLTAIPVGSDLSTVKEEFRESLEEEAGKDRWDEPVGRFLIDPYEYQAQRVAERLIDLLAAEPDGSRG